LTQKGREGSRLRPRPSTQRKRGFTIGPPVPPAAAPQGSAVRAGEATSSPRRRDCGSTVRAAGCGLGLPGTPTHVAIARPRSRAKRQMRGRRPQVLGIPIHRRHRAQRPVARELAGADACSRRQARVVLSALDATVTSSEPQVCPSSSPAPRRERVGRSGAARRTVCSRTSRRVYRRRDGPGQRRLMMKWPNARPGLRVERIRPESGRPRAGCSFGGVRSPFAAQASPPAEERSHSGTPGAATRARVTVVATFWCCERAVVARLRSSDDPRCRTCLRSRRWEQPDRRMARTSRVEPNRSSMLPRPQAMSLRRVSAARRLPTTRRLPIEAGASRPTQRVSRPTQAARNPTDGASRPTEAPERTA
jgi:hypothetical protein